MSVEQIQAQADGLAGRLGRAVLVDDRDLRLVAASEDFGDADPARVWSLPHRRTRPEDVRFEEIARLTGPGYVAENPALGRWQPGHDRGASEDHSRIIRHSYHSTDYTSPTRAADEHVRELEDETYLPGAVGPELVSKACVYDLTADRNFILDTVPGQPRIGLFVGAGHAAKFAGLIGHILADLAVDGQTGYPVAAFSMDRPAIRDPVTRPTSGSRGRPRAAPDSEGSSS